MVNYPAMGKEEMEETVRVNRGFKRNQRANPPGLLRFFPLGEPPSMTFHRLAVGATTIGRSNECHVVVPDREMSRHHATIIPMDDVWHIVDKDSVNGTYVGGERVRDRPLFDGELIRTGATLFRFLENGPANRDCEFTLEQGEMIAGPLMGQVLCLLDRAAGSELNVLLAAETGTGKELAARRLHQAGSRRRGPFVAVNCGAIPGELVESQLFGHSKGAFTGASSAHTGHFRAASGGTLFLDEVGELPLAHQPKLLRVLQERQVMPVGGEHLVPVDVRVVCATNRDPLTMVSEGAFRTDLYTRISDLTVALPPLRQRLEDIPLLLRHLIRKHDGGHRHLTVEVVEHLCCRPWPGNVRELESVIRRALHRAMGKGTPPYQSPAPYHSFKQADAMPLEPGVVAELRFDLLPTSYLFERGHRVRVAIGCADHTVFELRPSHPPQLQMHRSAEHPSHIVLPTMPEV